MWQQQIIVSNHIIHLLRDVCTAEDVKILASHLIKGLSDQMCALRAARSHVFLTSLFPERWRAWRLRLVWLVPFILVRLIEKRMQRTPLIWEAYRYES